MFDVLRKGIVKGSLRIIDSDGTFDFGSPSGKKEQVVLTVHNTNLWTRILTSYDIGSMYRASVSSTRRRNSPDLCVVAEAYMHGDVDISSLKGMFNVSDLYVSHYSRDHTADISPRSDLA